MSLRIPKFAVLMLLLLGCSGADLEPSDALVPDLADAGTQRLTFEDLSGASVFANDTVELVVRYQDLDGGPVAGILVEFSLTSSTSPGASLTPSRGVTDAQGLARTTLRAGSTAGELQVRARTAGADVAYLPLTVRQANASRVTVSLMYPGTRAVALYTVTALPGMDCATAVKSGLAGEDSFTFAAKNASAEFEVGAGLTAAIVAWGRDATGSKLVRGCREFTALSTEGSTKTQLGWVLNLEDLPISLDGELDVELELNVVRATQQLATAVKRSVDGVLMPSGSYAMFADADYYLDAVQKLLTEQGNSDGVLALSTLRQSTTLAASLAPALTQGAVGAHAIGDAVSALITSRGAGITLRSSYGAGQLTAISDLTVRSADGTKSLRWTNLDGAPMPTVSASSVFDAASAELRFESLRVALPLGRYGVTLLSGVEAESKGGPSTLTVAAGCSNVFGPWWAKSALTEVCEPSVAVAACEAAQRDLVTRIKTDLAGLDATSPALQLYGNVQVHDRSEDGKVDDLGPTALLGSWGTEMIQGELRVPVRTAFAR